MIVVIGPSAEIFACIAGGRAIGHVTFRVGFGGDTVGHDDDRHRGDLQESGEPKEKMGCCESHGGSCQRLRLSWSCVRSLVGRRFNALGNVRCNSTNCRGNKINSPDFHIFNHTFFSLPKSL